MYYWGNFRFQIKLNSFEGINKENVNLETHRRKGPKIDTNDVLSINTTNRQIK